MLTRKEERRNERPALHAQLKGLYSIIGDLLTILAAERGGTTQQNILERISYTETVSKKRGSKAPSSRQIRP